jgi:hypothetical protein
MSVAAGDRKCTALGPDDLPRGAISVAQGSWPRKLGRLPQYFPQPAQTGYARQSEDQSKRFKAGWDNDYLLKIPGSLGYVRRI